MHWFIKIPRIDLASWAPSHHWDGLLELWQGAGVQGLVLPMTLRDMSVAAYEELSSLTRKAKSHNLKVWLIMPLLNNPQFADQFATEMPEHREGETFEFPSWFSPICPSSKIYRGFLNDQSLEHIGELGLDAVILDYVRFPYFWEEWGNVVPENEWPPFCYCERCQQGFQLAADKSYREATLEEWQDWQGSVIADLLEAFCRRLKHQSSGPLTIGLQTLPLQSQKKRIMRSEFVGQDLKTLQKSVDFFSPLLYGRLLNWDADTILSYLVEFVQKQQAAIVPSFQISATRWDRLEGENSVSLADLGSRLRPLGIEQGTIFHAKGLLDAARLQKLI